MPTDYVRVGGTFVDANQEWVVRLYTDLKQPSQAIVTMAQ
jgi:hypothetical protein